MTMLTFGGFVDPDDKSVFATLNRERNEELINPSAHLEIEDAPFRVTGPKKFRFRWDAPRQTAVNTGNLVQDAAILTLNYFALWRDGEFASSDEVSGPTWQPLCKLLATTAEYAFDNALILHDLKQFQQQ